VDPKARGRGVGHALLAQVEAEVLRREGRLLVIETSDTPAYASARRLYETSGYHLEALVHDFYAPGDSLLVFVKNLAQAPGAALSAYPAAVDKTTAGTPLAMAGRRV
jgi:ribosomal protein S18 acetylase RimI-like enzyme